MKTSSEMATVETAGTLDTPGMSRIASPTDLQQFVAAARLLVDAALDRMLPAESVPPAKVHAAIRWSVFAGGKRFRPVLLLAVGETFGARPGTPGWYGLRAGDDSRLFVDSRRSAVNG